MLCGAITLPNEVRGWTAHLNRYQPVSTARFLRRHTLVDGVTTAPIAQRAYELRRNAAYAALLVR